MHNLKKWRMSLLICAIAFAACGGSGGGDAPQPTPSGNWDQATWDQSNWT
jgi:hypothetical protein